MLFVIKIIEAFVLFGGLGFMGWMVYGAYMWGKYRIDIFDFEKKEQRK
jgi:hypothetical protein